MGKEKIFCRDCCHWDGAIFCKQRRQFVKPQKGRYCQDFDKRKTKPIKEPEIVKEIEPIKEPEPRVIPKSVKKKVSFIKRLFGWRSKKD